MKFSFYHITDTHYFSKKNYDTDPESLPVFNDQLLLRESEELFKESLNIIKNDKDTDTVFFTGDVTNRGDIDSLNETYSLLTDAEKDLDIYAFLDTHDYFSDVAVSRINKDNQIYGVTVDNKEEKDKVRNAFSRFGIDKAKFVYKDNFTCFIEVKENVYYIQLRNYENEKGIRVIDEDVVAWVTEKAAELKKKGAFLFAGVHIPVLTPSPVYIILGNGSVPVNGEEIAMRFADAGISFILSGHSHMHSIRHIVSKNNNSCWEIGTGSLGGYPAKIRKLTLDTDSNALKIKTIEVNPDSLHLGKSVKEYGKEAFTNSLSPIFYNMEHDVEKFVKVGGGVQLPEEAILKHKEIVMKAGHTLNNMTFGKAGDFIRHATTLKKYEYEDIRDKRLIPTLLEIIADLYSGDAGYNPYSPEYKILMTFVAALDSVIKTFKIDLKKLIGYNDLFSIAEPLIYKGENNNMTIDLSAAVPQRTPPYKYVSHTGEKLIAATLLPFAVIIILVIKKITDIFQKQLTV